MSLPLTVLTHSFVFAPVYVLAGAGHVPLTGLVPHLGPSPVISFDLDTALSMAQSRLALSVSGVLPWALSLASGNPPASPDTVGSDSQVRRESLPAYGLPSCPAPFNVRQG